MSHNPRISKLSVRRSELKSTERFQEAIPLQLEIIELLEAEGAPSNELATAHNMASVLFFGAHRYSDAEWHARRALSLHTGDSVRDHEAYGAYHLVMARILASRLAFQEAALFGERAILEYSQFHNPPDQFLCFVIAEVERIKNHPWASMKVADKTERSPQAAESNVLLNE